jgi:RNA methyltransferase, TrmH family
MTGAPHSSVKRYRDLARNPAKNGSDRELLLDGAHLLLEARASGLAIESAVFQHDALDDPSLRTLAEQLAAEGADVFIVSKRLLDSMSPVRTPSGVIAIARRSAQTLDDINGGSQPLIVVAHDVQDPGNVGGIVRTAEAAGATAFIASAGTADPFGWKALRGSMGSALRLPIVRAGIDDTLRALRSAGVSTTALVPRGGQPMFSSDFRKPLALVLGGEGSGVPDDLSRRLDHLMSIPMRAPVESLNVGVAAALVLYEAFRQRQRQ